jgi:hypothetical protein
MHNKKAGPSYHLEEARPEKRGWKSCGDPIGSSMRLRHRCYMDSTPSIIAANAAAVDEADES